MQDAGKTVEEFYTVVEATAAVDGIGWRTPSCNPRRRVAVQREQMQEQSMNAGTVLKQFYDAVQQRDMAKARGYLADDLVFVGLFETYPNADAYIATFTALMQIVTRLDVKVIIGEGDNAAIFFEMTTTAPAEATTLVAEWHQTRNGKIIRAISAFDGRPFAAMFAGQPQRD
jgi:ketosteroid isomerase-like protein